MDIGFVALAVVSFLGSMALALTGFGSNIFFQLCWYLLSLGGITSGRLTQSTTIATIINIPLAIVQAINLRRWLNVKLAVVIAVSGAGGNIAGVLMLLHFDEESLKHALGVILFVVFISQAGMEWQRSNRAKTAQLCPAEPLLDLGEETEGATASASQRLPLACLAGLCSGVLGGIYSTPGPPLMVYVLLATVDKNEWRATQAVPTSILLPIRLVALLSLGQADIDMGALSPQCGVCFLSGLAGLLTGNRLAKHISEESFRGFVLLCLLWAAETFLTAGRGDLSCWATLLTGVFAAGFAVVTGTLRKP